MKLPNLYFTLLLILEMIPVVGSGYPTLIMPISFVVALSMIKDGFEDYQRAKSDDEENNRLTDCIEITDHTNNKNKITDADLTRSPMDTSNSNLIPAATNDITGSISRIDAESNKT
jgi:hypothetical protein